jgi:hypothetical protein
MISGARLLKWLAGDGLRQHGTKLAEKRFRMFQS